MRTHTHFLITCLIWDLLNRRRPPISTGKAFLIGSVLPDMPLMFLTLWYFVHRLKSDNPPSEDSPFYGPEYDSYFFHNRYWIALSSLFLAPFLLMMYFIVAAIVQWLGFQAGTPLLWFCVSCAFNSVLNIFTHVQDGVVILFPFNWNYRFHSWVSYYEPEYGGRIFTVVEFSVDGLLLLYFAFRAFQYSFSQKRLNRYVELQQYTVDHPIV